MLQVERICQVCDIHLEPRISVIGVDDLVQQWTVSHPGTHIDHFLFQAEYVHRSFFLTPVSLCLQEEPRVQPSGSVLHNVHFHPGFFLLRRIIPSSGDWQANSTPVIFVKLQACGTCQHPPAVILRIILGIAMCPQPIKTQLHIH